jgi:DNA-binding IclR family transcriptional regulator
MTTADNAERGIQTVAKVFDIIQLIEEVGQPTFTELTAHVEMADSTLYDYLTTLERVGYITKDDGVYRLTLRFYGHGRLVREQIPVLEPAKEVLRRTAEETGATVWLMVEENGKAVHIAKEDGEYGIETHGYLGKHEYLHCISGGKAILANLRKKRVTEILDRYGMPPKTPYTITSREELLEELEQIREQGYAINDRETAEGAWAVGAPIMIDGHPEGALAIPEPITRMNSEDHRQNLIDQVTSASNEIELSMTFDQ